MIVKRLRDLFIFICKKSRRKIVSPIESKLSEYNIPFHIQEEIMKRLPVKSLIRFRSVSKAWKSLIDSSKFIAAHHTQPQHLLLGYECLKKKKTYACFVDDETLFQQRPVPNYPPYFRENRFTEIVGISHGLVCLHSSNTNRAGIWNPSIRKSIVVAVPKYSFVGFGVCPITTDPKIVAFKKSLDESNMDTGYQCKVMVYTLSSNNWRSLSTHLPTAPLQDCSRVVSANGFVYWLGGLTGHHMIISFDVTNEGLEMIDLPTTLARPFLWPLHIHKLRESLAILQYERSTYTVWVMEGDVQRSFTKLFTIRAPPLSLVGFRKSGVPIRQVGINGHIKLVVYEHDSEHRNVLKVTGHRLSCTMNSYTETLLLLGRSDCSSY